MSLSVYLTDCFDFFNIDLYLLMSSLKDNLLNHRSFILSKLKKGLAGHIYTMASNHLSWPMLLGVHRVLCSHWGILLLKALFLIDGIQLNANEVLEYLPVEGNCVLSDSSPGVIP